VPRGVMVIDLFGLDADEVRKRFPEVYQHVLLKVKTERDANRRASYAANWWIFGEPRRELRPALAELNPEDERIKDQGLVLILKELHERLDRLVFEAYGWPATLTDEEILERLVALNKQRSIEEKTGGYPEFREFVQAYQRKESGSEGTAAPVEELVAATSSAPPSTPYEQIDAAARTLNTALEAELLARIRSVDPSKFEQLVVDLLINMGFGGGDPEMGEHLGGTGDGGIDGVIQEDALGLDAVYVQAKRYQDGNTVGAPALQAFVGSLVGQRANKGVFVTSSKFTQAGKDYVRNVQHRIVLIDGEEFARLLVRHGVGVREDRTVTIKKMDEDYFAE
jgi:restriction system protein